MRVIHVAPIAFGPTGLFGGGERYPLELAHALATDVDCELITFGTGPALTHTTNGLRVRTLRPLTFLRGHPANPVAWGLPLALREANIVHTHHLRTAPSKLAALAARIRGQRLVVTDHGYQGSDWAGLLQSLFHRFLTVSIHSAHELRAEPARTRVIYGGADPIRFAPNPATRRDGALFVGRLTPHKGVDRLIESLPRGTRLLIAGSDGHDPKPPERDYPLLLRQLAAGRDVAFLGPVADSDLPSLYRQAQVVALPSVDRTRYGRAVRVSELLGLAAIEAMASGTPVVCSRLGGIPEVVQHGVTGFLVEPGNVDELRDRLAEILGDRALAARLGRNARDLVAQRFTWRACASRCLEAYAEVL